MAYADATYYRSTYIGRTCSNDTTLGKWLSRASDDIDILNFGAITIADLTATELDYLKKATCAQAENYVINGEEVDSAESFSIGAFSLKQSSGTRSNGVICNRAAEYLSLAGFGSRAIGGINPRKTWRVF